MVKEFFVCLEERVGDKVFARGKWINMLSEAINKLIGAPGNEKGGYTTLMDEGVEIAEIVKKLRQVDKEVIRATCNKNQNLSFNARAL